MQAEVQQTNRCGFKRLISLCKYVASNMPIPSASIHLLEPGSELKDRGSFDFYLEGW